MLHLVSKSVLLCLMQGPNQVCGYVSQWQLGPYEAYLQQFVCCKWRAFQLLAFAVEDHFHLRRCCLWLVSHKRFLILYLSFWHLHATWPDMRRNLFKRYKIMLWTVCFFVKTSRLDLWCFFCNLCIHAVVIAAESIEILSSRQRYQTWQSAQNFHRCHIETFPLYDVRPRKTTLVIAKLPTGPKDSDMPSRAMASVHKFWILLYSRLASKSGSQGTAQFPDRGPATYPSTGLSPQVCLIFYVISCWTPCSIQIPASSSSWRGWWHEDFPRQLRSLCTSAIQSELMHGFNAHHLAYWI